MCAKRLCLPDPAAAVTDDLIASLIEPNSRVIDLGCGDARLLEKLRADRGASVLGVEIDHEGILDTIGRGVPVVQVNLDEPLSDIPDQSFDIAVLSQTLQQVRRPKDLLQEMMRIAHRALVVVPNFGYWKIRLQVLRSGKTPVTEALPYEWYDTPNLHYMTLHDVHNLAEQLGYRITAEIQIINGRTVERAWGANFRAESALFIIENTTS